MPELEPITREEKFLNGEVGMTPITREEKILAGEDVETITRREYFLKKYRGGGGGDVTVEEITITENGTTTAPSGKAYSPIHTNVPQPTLSTLEVSENGDYDAPSGTVYNRVEVDVPLPQNAYLNKALTGLPADIATFNDGEAMPLSNLKVGIEPVQDLHGYDAPWAGGAGKNKFDGETKNGYIYNGTYYASDDYWCNKNDIPVKPNTTYIFSGVVSNGQICCYNSNKQYTGDVFSPNASFTTPSNCAYISIYNPISTVGNNKQLEEGSTATSYEPYSNECPIIGWSEANVGVSGKNLVDWKLVSFSSTVNTPITLKQGTYTLSQSEATNTGNYYIQAKKSDGTYLTKTELGLSGWSASSTEGVYYGAPNERSFTFTITEDNVTVKIGCQTPASTIPAQLEFGSTATAYEPYNPNSTTYTIDLGETRYGAELNVVNGILVIDRILLDSSLFEKYAGPNYNGYISYMTSETINNMSNQNTMSNMINRFLNFSPSSVNEPRCFVDSNETEKIYVSLPTGVNISDLQVAYKLETPINIQLTPTAVKSLRGVNNLFADCGQVQELSYFSKEV